VHVFFALFKPPGEPAGAGVRYRALLVGGGAHLGRCDADLVLLFGAEPRPTDRRLRIRSIEGPADVRWDGEILPVYGGLLLFDAASAIGASCNGRAVDVETPSGRQTVHRIGYDLFGEVRRLLSDGQPAAHALAPTLELHIALVRAILDRADVPYIEIAPRPFGYDFTCCLTHDLDFFGIRRHGLDRTMAGFLYRSTIGTLVDLLRGRRTAGEALANWRACLTLPLVFAGLRRDPWHPIDDYAQTERPEESTFFVVPFSAHPGAGLDGAVHASRAVPYQASDVAAEVRAAVRQGSEIALHGIDAWRDSAAGVRECDAVSAAAGSRPAGVRMHWLYSSPDTPARLEAAGFSYDSTCGYNDAVGFRAGTAQVFRPFGCRRLLELPLSIMDSALLFPNRMNLAPSQAARRMLAVITSAVRFGGVLVVNWHDRSLAPERQWTRIYRTLLSELRTRHQVWFTTGEKAVEWYRWRRSIRFVRAGDDVTVLVGEMDPARPLPEAALTIRAGSAGDRTTRCQRLEAGTAITVPYPTVLQTEFPWQLRAI
jgi:peptidoglycan/xylan/chitin deacetylase (PgdA/CDA1 family)